MTRTRQHSQQVWENFWEQRVIESVYSNSDRIVQQIEATGDVADKWILEIGAGSGRDSFKLLDMGAKVILLDYAASSLRVISALSSQRGKKVYLVRGDAFHLPFKAESIDLIFHQGLLEHFTHPGDIIRESYYATKIGGYHISDVPQRYHLYTAVKHILIWLNKWFAGWETEFSIKQLKKLHWDAGYKIHHVYGDWMRPSFVYRAAREALKKVGLMLPQYPKRIPVLSCFRDKWRQFLKKRKIAYYTFMDIGVVAVKKD
ncbi:class I SAM-dependent methyltransferase [candidate division KSB1 bacterium]|nr:class I SAM-dependent methyltransferase [candidate division KSB1 bacterium]RQW05521.1 MAG: class I SAM-dependent methyltransferase [candidate division KSB1 bacterium]